jgi:hypothetical protein
MVPFVKVSRDRRGNEHFLLVLHVSHGSKSGPRVLYWFRTPPNLKVGREPFDEAVRRALEAQNPDIVFDWERLRETPVPLAQPEYWRERRRAERAARRLHEVEDGGPTSDSPDSDEHSAESHARGQRPRESAEAVAQPRVGETASMRRHRRRRRRGRQGNEQGVAGGGQPSAPSTPPQPETADGEVFRHPLAEPEKTQ